jgi:hypothetical protein
MAERLSRIFTKLALVVVVGVVATAGIAYAAEQQLATPVLHHASTAKPRQAVLVVPDVHSQAFVFAKGVLQDSGFAWRVHGPVQGFAPNVVVGQSPAPGTRVLDTGAPLVILTLARNGHYSQGGVPQNSSPYRPTALRPADLTPTLLTPYSQGHLVKPKPTAKSTPVLKPIAEPKPVAKPKPAAEPKPMTKPKASSRPTAFAVPGAPREPLDEMPLPDRARLLERWIATKPKVTNANVKRWLYQNAWIVTGARFGWWHGAEALQILVDVDRQTESLWGIGAKSRLLAENALSYVQSRSS